MPSSQPALPADRSLVVQFYAPPSGGSPTYDGRVEHLVSGQEVRFHSLEELLAFMIGIPTEVLQQTDAEGQRTASRD
jgi:hypothetical protein